jgi:hypothetical protein
MLWSNVELVECVSDESKDEAFLGEHRICEGKDIDRNMPWPLNDLIDEMFHLLREELERVRRHGLKLLSPPRRNEENGGKPITLTKEHERAQRLSLPPRQGELEETLLLLTHWQDLKSYFLRKDEEIRVPSFSRNLFRAPPTGKEENKEGGEEKAISSDRRTRITHT